MTARHFLLLPILLLLSSCQVDSPETTPEKPSAENGAAVVQDSDFVGLSLKEAEALAEKSGLPHRVVMIDGQPQAATRDYRPDRVNFETQSGKVVKVTRG